MAVVLGLVVAITYGTGDFFGGLAVKRSPATAVVIGSFAIATILLLATTLAWAVLGGLASPHRDDLVLGVAAGIIGPVALGLLYQGLATARMSVVAPTTAVVAAIVPFAWGLIQGERPSTLAMVGVIVALAAVALISGAPTPAGVAASGSTRSSAQALPGAVLSGLGFGVVFVLFGSTTQDAGLWPLLAARLVAVAATATAVAAWATSRHRSARSYLRPAAGAWAPVAVAGVFDITANGTYLAATHRGLLSLVAVLSSLYPASTVVLARVVLKERFHRLQVLGLVIATVGVAAIAAG